MDTYSETKMIMGKYHISANKSLGQNFLIDDKIKNLIIDTSNITKKDLIIEIGPGLGILTKTLLEKAGKVLVIELDKKMVQILHDRFSINKNFECIINDVLKVNLKELIEQNKKDNINKVKIVANLPYYITTPIIMKLLEGKLDIDLITVMVQKEVADRLVAIPGDKNTGAITYAIRYYTNPKEIIEVPKTAFIPMPKVDSAIIKLEVLKEPSVKLEDDKMFFKVIKLAFMQKRKTLLNSLTNGKLFGEKEEIEKMLNVLNIDTRIRPEKLSIETFSEIANYLSNQNRRSTK